MKTEIPLNIPVTALFTGYSLVCGFSYLCGFWQNFNIDLNIIVSLLSPLDVLKSFIIPFISFFGVYICNLVFTLISSQNNESVLTKKNSLFNIISSQMFIVAALLLALCIYILYKYYTTNNRFYFNAFIFIAICFSFLALSFREIFKYNFDVIERNMFSISLIYFIPAIILLVGHKIGSDIIKKEDTLIMVDNSICSKNPDEHFLLLALYGSKGISLSLEKNDICIFNSENVVFKSKHSTQQSLSSVITKII